jgi:Tol biopolymer transport system component
MNGHAPATRATALARTIATGIVVVAVAGCSGGSNSTPTPPAVVTGSPQPGVSLPAATPTTSPTSAAARGGRIAFGVKDAGGIVQIWSAGSNGADLRQLTTGPGSNLCPTYSADRTLIAYCSNESGNFEIWTVSSDGTRQAQLTHLGGTALFPNFSPDGHLIAFGGNQGASSAKQIEVVDATTGGLLRALTNCTGQKSGCSSDYPAWSPDGKKIAFIHADDTDGGGNPVNQQVWVMDADGSHAHALTSDPAPKDELPEWSPDGSLIAYASGRGGSEGIWLMTADGSNQHQISGCAPADTSPCAAGDDFGPVWSPDGTQIAFLRDFGAVGQTDRTVWVMNADGSSPHRLIPGPALHYVPAW